MTKMNPQAEKESEIERQWYALPDQERTRERIEDFADDVRRQGLGLMRDPALNVQAVRGLLRMF
jgi:hypothetical protein